MDQSIAVETVNTLDDAAAVEREWHALLQRAGGATPFQSPEWLLSWYAVWAPDRIHMLIARARGAALAIVPAVQSDGRLELAGGGISDYLAPVIDASAAADAGAALDSALSGCRCVFSNVPGDIPWPDAAGGAARWQVGRASTCPVIPLPATVDAWREALPSGLRRNLRRYGTRIAKDAGGQFRTVEREEELQPALEALVRLHSRRWCERACPGVFADADVQRFHTMSAPRLFARHMLRLHLLCAGASVIAAQYVLVAGRRAFGYIAGFDPAWSRYSPGALLLAYSVEHAIGEGCVEFDLLRGTEMYKYAWGAVDRTTWCFTR